MRVFHDEEDETAGEPVPGLPAALPEGEAIVWQGQPRAMSFALNVFHLRLIGLYFVVATGYRVAGLLREGAEVGVLTGAVLSAGLICLAAFALLYGLAVLMVRSTLYTLTTHRVVLRYGVAIRKYINLPFGQIESAGLNLNGTGTGDIALRLAGGKVSFLNLWPHARPLRFFRVEPMLRALPEPRHVAGLLAKTIHASAPEAVRVPAPGQSEPAEQKVTQTGSAGLAMGT